MNWFQKLFFPSELAVALKNYRENNSAQFAVFKAFQNSIWFFHTFFFTSLRVFGYSDRTRALYTLNRAGLLTGDAAQAYFNAVVKDQYPLSVVDDALRTLTYHDKIMALKEAYLSMNWFQKLFFPSELAVALKNYRENNSAQFAVFKAFQNSTWFFHTFFFTSLRVFGYSERTRALYTLNRAGLLTGDAAQAHFNAVVVTHSAILLHPNNRLNGVNVWARIPHGRPTEVEFQTMIQLAQTHAANPIEGAQAFMGYVTEQILHMNPQQNIHQQPAPLDLNEEQLTLLQNEEAKAEIGAAANQNRFFETQQTQPRVENRLNANLEEQLPLSP